ncbi:unnamed protein product [Ixodes hexagonus]
MCHSMTTNYKHILRQVITLIYAVSICMVSVVCLVRVLKPSKNDELLQPYVRYPVEYGEEPVLLMNSFANAFSFLSMIMIVNCTLVLLYKGGYTNIIKAWLMTGSGVLLFVVTYYYVGRCVYYFNFPLDHLTCSFIVWNIGMAGMATLYFNGPVVMHQGFVIYVSVLMAVVLEETFPEWTTWILLVLVSLWDIFAVLCVIGPLRMLIETANERNEPLFPALLFSTSSAWYRSPGRQTPTGAEELPIRLLNLRCSTNAEDSFAVARTEAPQERIHQQAAQREWCAHHPHHHHQGHLRHQRHRHGQSTGPEDRGMKMGLGDFIFYSILVGKASRHGTVSAAIACYIFVVIGILSTLALLVILQKPMPALPLSIGLGMFAYFWTIFFVEPFLEEIGFLAL